MPLLTKIPAAAVPANQQSLLRELDKDRLIQRAPGEARGDDALDPSEVKAALANLSSFSPDEQAAIKGWAQLLGVDGGNAGAPVKRAWQVREPMPRTNNDVTLTNAVTVGGRVYANHGEQGYQAISRFDPAVNTWTEVASPSQNLWHGWMREPTLGAVGNSLVAMGGYNGQQIWPYAFRYDVDSKQWQQMPDVPTPRWNMATADLDGKLFAAGGATKPDYLGNQNDALSKAFELYDPATNAWSKLPDLPVARSGASAIAVDGKIYVIGGKEAGTQVPYAQASNRVDVFDPKTNTWQDPPYRMPTAVSSPSLFLQDGKIAVTGGLNSDMKPNLVVETLDPATGKNGELPPVNFENTAGVSVLKVGDDLVALGSAARDDKGAEAIRVKAFAPVDPPAGQGGGGGNVINVITNNTTNVTNVDVTNVIKNISNTTVVNNTTIDASSTTLNVDNNNVSVIAPTTNNIYSDVDNNFFLRASLKDKPMISVGVHDGQRYVVGSAIDGKGPMPKNADVCLFDPDSKRAFKCRTDAAGQFACAIPDDVHGRLFAFRLDATGPASSAAPIDVP